jgi:cytochrome c-type biogenesis protein CcmH/NrfF
VLYGAPFAALLIGGALVWRLARRRQAVPAGAAALTEEEKARLAKLLDGR